MYVRKCYFIGYLRMYVVLVHWYIGSGWVVLRCAYAPGHPAPSGMSIYVVLEQVGFAVIWTMYFLKHKLVLSNTSLLPYKLCIYALAIYLYTWQFVTTTHGILL